MPRPSDCWSGTTRLSSSRSLTAYGSVTYANGPNGDLSSRTDRGQTTSYGYDALGNLRYVAQPGGTQIEYVIDGRNRRIGKKVDGALVEGFL